MGVGSTHQGSNLNPSPRRTRIMASHILIRKARYTATERQQQQLQFQITIYAARHQQEEALREQRRCRTILGEQLAKTHQSRCLNSLTRSSPGHCQPANVPSNAPGLALILKASSRLSVCWRCGDGEYNHTVPVPMLQRHHHCEA